MVFLVKTKHSDSVRYFYSEDEMIAAGFKKADKTVEDEEFNSNGCYAWLIDGEIVVGKTQDEKDEDERQAQINAYKSQLMQIDQEAMAGRAIRELVLELAERAGIGGDAVEILQNYESKAKPIRVQLAPLLKSEIAE